MRGGQQSACKEEREEVRQEGGKEAGEEERQEVGEEEVGKIPSHAGKAN